MQRLLLLLFMSIAGTTSALAQVTKLASNKSLDIEVPLGKNKAILHNDGTSGLLWVTDGTPAGTFVLSDTLTYEGMGGGLLGDKYIFAATSPNLGSELWITDGTVNGTKLVKDIVPGKPGSEPTDDFAPLGGYLYFTASVPGFGRELWRTNGTEAGTTMVRDIIPGAAGSGTKDTYNIASTGSFLLFSAVTTAEGYELWRSDGTEGSTFLLKDIYPGITGSQPSAFQTFSGVTYFWATTQNEGRELWRTNGTEAGTSLVKDIRPGPLSSLNAPIPYQNLSFLYPLNGKLLFMANDGTHGEEIWFTDGTGAGTDMLVDISPEPIPSMANFYLGVQMKGKLYFTAYRMDTGAELWETDGTKAGTKLFKEILPGSDGGIPLLMPNLQITVGNPFPVHKGDVFYFLFAQPVDGVELWKSDGTEAGTVKVKTLKTIGNDFVNVSWVYTKAGLYFSADDGVIGDEIWKSDGTETGTSLVIDLNPNIGEGSEVTFFPIPINGRFVFTGTDGDNEFMYDLYALDGDLVQLPVKLESVTVSLAGTDGQLKWQTASEENTLDFVVERSVDGKTFSRIGAVAAAGHSTDKKSYSFNDAAVANSGKTIVYYRLRMRDRDGKEAFSKIVSLNLKGGADFTVQLLGNPVRGDLKLTFGKTPGAVNLTVRDAAGRTIKALLVKNEDNVISVPAGDLLPGAYFLVAECNGKSSIVKFLKQ